MSRRGKCYRNATLSLRHVQGRSTCAYCRMHNTTGVDRKYPYRRRQDSVRNWARSSNTRTRIGYLVDADYVHHVHHQPRNTLQTTASTPCENAASNTILPATHSLDGWAPSARFRSCKDIATHIVVPPTVPSRLQRATRRQICNVDTHIHVYIYLCQSRQCCQGTKSTSLGPPMWLARITATAPMTCQLRAS